MSAVRRFAHGSRVPGWDRAVDLDRPPAEVPEPATTEVPPALREEIEAHMALYPDPRSAALPALAAAQRVHGWCSPEALEQVAAVMGVTPAYLQSVASFYDMLENEPVARHSVYVCTNISCSLCGADALLEAVAQRVEQRDADVNVRSFECLGACDIAPMASVDGVYVGPLSPADVDPLLDDLAAGRPPLPALQLARRPRAGAPPREDAPALTGTTVSPEPGPAEQMHPEQARPPAQEDIGGGGSGAGGEGP